MSSRLPVLSSSLIFLLAAVLAQPFFKADPLAHIPVVGKGGKEARRKQYVSGGSESIVVAPKYMPELRRLPDDILSFTEASNESLQSEYTHMNSDAPGLPQIVKSMLTPALVRLNPIISTEVAETMASELPQSGEWEEVDINQKLLRIVAIVSGRIFVGPELCRNETYIDSAINYTIDVMVAVYMIGLVPVWLRPFLAPRLPFVKKLEKRIQEADDFLRPVVKERRTAMQDPSLASHDDMLQWIINSEIKRGNVDDKAVAKLQLSVSMAAIHTTTLTALNALYTLAAMPHLVPELRDEIRQALKDNDGEFGSPALQSMKKLDSFLKETMRCFPLSAVSFQRKVLKPFALSNGQTIPAGVIVEVPAGSIAADGAIFDNPGEFDHLRYYKMRQSKGSQATGSAKAEVVANSQFVSVSESSLTFGYGRHACPGRFFAANEIKMIMANILLHYEIRNPDGVTERHKNVRTGSQLSPDHTKRVMIKKIQGDI
ncbi:ent-kaurene oxidase [Colletotrichum higginsianum]|nr:ent-kaurene oxidase [Colletotrichum higginsianum]